MKYFPAFSLAAVILCGCGEPPQPPPSPAAKPGQPSATTNSALRSFDARGVIRELPGGDKAVIRHEAIPGYMPKMTMELTVRNTNELRGLQAGDEISFKLFADADTHWIEFIQRLKSAPALVSTPPSSRQAALTPKLRELQPGDLMLDAELLAETGRTVKFSDFRGRALAFTFIFTRCPLPDFCPRMGNRFKEARELLFAAQNTPTNWQFLSISFDPDYDSPPVLANYARNYRGTNADRWLYAVASTNALAQVASPLDLKYAREGGSISHNLRTVVLDPAGRIHRQFDGNTWKAAELAQALTEAALTPAPKSAQP
ncbi:MAG: SCO family protein [Limisphaerales bacterium]